MYVYKNLETLEEIILNTQKAELTLLQPLDLGKVLKLFLLSTSH